MTLESQIQYIEDKLRRTGAANAKYLKAILKSLKGLKNEKEKNKKS